MIACITLINNRQLNFSISVLFHMCSNQFTKQILLTKTTQRNLDNKYVK